MKNVHRLLLLVLFAFSGCESFNQTINGDSSGCEEVTLADLIGGATDVNLTTTGLFVVSIDAITKISDDAKTMSIIVGTMPETLEYVEGGDDWATYKDYVHTLTLKNIVLKEGIVTGDLDFYISSIDAVDTGTFRITK